MWDEAIVRLPERGRMNEDFIDAKLPSGEKLLINSERVLYYVYPDESEGCHDETAIATIVYDNGERLEVLNGWKPRSSLLFLQRPQLPAPQFVDRRAEKIPHPRPRRTRGVRLEPEWVIPTSSTRGPCSLL